ncbi:uncharacterized protein N7483_008856 [Penicillium malachiteum]|uniref:uncharacterized protein n=1 Tax=Penicillium malachiteum TaxID=1324776 RepID=UPI002547512C|nr:uncharacterized protein N7483_008856 [Penicillium malachiteum]KAJ5720922.1 hypothetical protein N7483_008856 [Penicillium malachiteum]
MCETYPGLDILSAQKVKRLLRDTKIEVEPTVHSSAQCTSPVSSSFIPVERLKGIAHNTEFGNDAIPYAIKDHADEDFNSSQRLQAMGFIGEHSAIAWLFEIKRRLAKKTTPKPGDTARPPSISAMNYFRNEAKVETHEDDNQWTLPPKEAADRLIDHYFRAIHHEFPVIGKLTFCWQYQTYFSNPNARPGRRWVALLNLVFAIAAKVSSLASESHRENPERHAIYFSRAWRLGIHHVALENYPDIQQVQVEALAAFYFLCVGDINRAWRMLGTAFQSAVAMGLHLRNSANEVQFSSKEIRYRVWWALFVMDSLLQVITGRPPKTNTNFCTTPLPIPFREEDLVQGSIRHLLTDLHARNQFLRRFLSFTGMADRATGLTPSDCTQIAGSEWDKALSDEQTTKGVTDYVSSTTSTTPKLSLFFVHAVDLAHLTHKVIEVLYSPEPAQRSSSDLEILISSFNDSVDGWLLYLPQEFNFTRATICGLSRHRL